MIYLVKKWFLDSKNFSSLVNYYCFAILVSRAKVQVTAQKNLYKFFFSRFSIFLGGGGGVAYFLTTLFISRNHIFNLISSSLCLIM